MSRGQWLKAFALAAARVVSRVVRLGAQDWTDYLHWPYVPPQAAGSGFEYNGLHDNFYVYPRDQRIVPQIQGPYYRNFYGGYRVLGMPPSSRLARLAQEEVLPGLSLHPGRLLSRGRDALRAERSFKAAGAAGVHLARRRRPLV